MNYHQRGLRALYEYRIKKRLGTQKDEEVVAVPDDAMTVMLQQLAEENKALRIRVQELEAQLEEAKKPNRQPSVPLKPLEFSADEHDSFVIRALCQELLKSR